MIKAIKKGRITHQVLRNEEVYEIEPILIIKYNINVGKTFENKEWTKILDENKYYYYDRIGQVKLKKALTKKEVIDFLTEKDANEQLINSLITKYLNYGYIDDNKYTKLFIDIRKTKDGPKLLFKKLKDKGISETIINKHLSLLNEQEIINTFITSKFKQVKNQTVKQTVTKLKQTLLNKGYTFEVINEVIDKNIDLIEVDEEKLLEKEYDKLFNRKKANIELNDFKFKTRNKLLQKGFNIEKIKLIEDKYIK